MRKLVAAPQQSRCRNPEEQYDTLTPALNQFRVAYPLRRHESGWVEEQMHGIMEGLLKAHRIVLWEVEKVKAVRASTREELFRRIHRARDYICSSLPESLSLDDMAAVACLSPNHCLRSFRQILGQTPHQFMVSKRMERAANLLAATDRSVTEIALAVGFESLGSFSWLFRRHFGVSPRQFRVAKR